MEFRYDLIHNSLVIVCTLLLVLIPVLVLKINQFLHKVTDAPWKQKLENEQEECFPSQIEHTDAEN